MRIPMDLASPRYKGMPLLNTSWPCRLTQQFKALNHSYSQALPRHSHNAFERQLGQQIIGLTRRSLLLSSLADQSVS